MANITITAASVVPPTTNITYIPGKIAGESLSAGDWVYLKAADGKIWKASNNTASEATVIGMAANSAAAGQPVNVIQKVASLPIGSVVSSGTMYFIGLTAGKMFLYGDHGTSLYPLNVCQAVSDSAITFDFTTPRTPTLWLN